jgi:hypothetical protein
VREVAFSTLPYMLSLRGISNSPIKQGVGAFAQTALFFPCEFAFYSH